MIDWLLVCFLSFCYESFCKDNNDYDDDAWDDCLLIATAVTDADVKVYDFDCDGFKNQISLDLINQTN